MYSFINFQIDDTVVLTIVIMLYIKYALKTQSTIYYIVINLKISKREQERYILISEVDKLWGGH